MSQFFRKLVFTSIFLFLFSTTFVTKFSAQDLDDVTISGKVSDSNGLAIVGANITATLLEKGIERTVTTNEDGRYRLIELAPGIYKIKVSANGFGAKERIDLSTISGQNLQLDFTLAPANIQAEQTVTVTEENVPAVDITRTIVGGTVTQREIEELPNNSRNPLDLVFTLGGVTEEPLSTRDLSQDKGSRGESSVGGTPEEAGTFALSGGAAYSNNITIDGLDNNDDRAATFRFQPTLDSVAEVQVITNQFSSEYGRASGGRVNLRTRSGTKEFRGRASYFFEDESLNANTWRNNSRINSFGLKNRIPARQSHVPVFSFGGPIPLGYFKNRTFFFAAYEYQNVLENTTIDTFIPVGRNSRLALPSPTTTTGQICENINNPAACTLAQPTAAFIAPYLEDVPTPLRNHTLSARIDHNFADTHNITFNLQYGERRDFRQFSGGSRLAESLVGNSRETQAYSLTDNYVFSSRIVNQIRFQYSTLTPAVISDTALSSPVSLISLPGVLDRGTTLTAGSSTSGSSDRKEDRWQFQDTLTYIAGDHSLKFGGDFQRVESLYIDRSDATGTFNFGSATIDAVSYSPIQNFLLNQVTRYRHNFGASSTQRNNYYGFFAQDEWRFNSAMTMTYGLRYEKETIIDDNNNFGPRVGIAWSPFKDKKGVIRFGAGIFYNRALLRTLDDYSLTTNTLIFDTNTISTTNGARQTVLDNISARFPNALSLTEVSQLCTTNNLSCGNAAFGRTIDPNIKIPESYQFNVGIEREIGKGFVIEANYTWNKTAHLWREFNANAISLAKLNSITGGNYTNFAEYLLSRDFDNFPGAGNTARPLLGGTTTTSANRIRFILTPFNTTASGAQVGVGISNPDLGGIICINGAATCANATNNPNVNRYYLINLNSVTATNGSSPITTALAVLNQFRPDPTREQLEQLASIGNSEYGGLIVELRRRFRPLGYGFGASFRFVYTLSSLRDDGIVNTSSAQISGDFQSEWARALQDRRHRLAFSGTFNTPNWFGKLLLSPIVRFGSSAPFSLSAGGVDRNLDDVNTDRPNFNGDLNSIVWREPNSAFPQDVLNGISYATIGANGGNLPRNVGKGPKLFLFDMNVSREFKITQNIKLRPNIEVNNVFNARVFTFSSTYANGGFINANADSSLFLVPTRTYRPREIRLGVRFDF